MDIKNDQNVVTFNLRGRVFITYKNLFCRIPDSKLNKLLQSNPTEREFYFDRNPILFDNILDVFKSGEFHIPNGICGAVVVHELEYWCIPKYYIAKCCMKTYSCYLEEIRIMKEIHRSFWFENVSKYPMESDEKDSRIYNVNHNEVNGSKANDQGFGKTNDSYDFNDDSITKGKQSQIEIPDDRTPRHAIHKEKELHNGIYSSSKQKNSYELNKSNFVEAKTRKWFYYLQRFLEDPFSSKPALIWGCFFLLLVVTSVSIQCLGTHPNFRVPLPNVNSSLSETSSASTLVDDKNETFTTVLTRNKASSTSNDNFETSQFDSGVTQSLVSEDNIKNLLPRKERIIVSNCQNSTNTLLVINDDIPNSSNFKINLYRTTERHPVLTILQYACLIAFALEILVRFVICQNRKYFLFNFYNSVDLLALIPTVALELMLIFSGLNVMITNEVYFKISFFLSTMGVFKTLRLVKFFRHFNAMKVLLLALRASLREISLLLILITIGMLIFSTLIYHTEFYTDDFQTIPIGFWWSIVTMTTVGYGDTHPTTAWGYLVGAMCALAGMLSTGLPIPIIANNFNLYYTHAKVHMCDLRIRNSNRHNVDISLNNMAFENNAISTEEGHLEETT